jgi:hypothetical protein
MDPVFHSGSSSSAKEQHNGKTIIRHLLLLALFFAVTWSSSATGYEFYSGNNDCKQRHPDFDGFGDSLHDFHNTFVDSCTDCHSSIGDNPMIEKCAACHIPEPLWNAHNSAPVDEMGFRCSQCHSFVGNDQFSWGETKALFE